MNNGYAAECFSRRYMTCWNTGQCRGFLLRRNVFDLFEYRFDQEQDMIVFRWKWSDRQRDYRELNTQYRISFTDSDAGAVFEIAYIEDDRSPRGILDADLDEFFCIKLDAVPC